MVLYSSKSKTDLAPVVRPFYQTAALPLRLFATVWFSIPTKRLLPSMYVVTCSKCVVVTIYIFYS